MTITSKQPYNADKEGLCRTLKSQYYKNGKTNFEQKGAFGATGVIEKWTK